MKKIILSLTAICAGSISAGADVPASFQEFRQGILNDYQDFRSKILEHYADFLDGTWHEYEPMEPLKKEDYQPKPIKVPNVKVRKPSTRPVELPKPKLATIPDGERVKIDVPYEEDAPVPIPPEAVGETPLSLKVRPDVGTPVLGRVTPVAIPRPISKTTDPLNLPQQPQLPDSPELAQLPERSQMPDLVDEQPVAEESMEGKEIVKFYDMEIAVPKVDFAVTETMTKVSDLARHWRALADQDVANRVNSALQPVISKLGLNDYLTLEFLCAYMDSKFPTAGISSRVSAVHYLLANLGYNARIAIATRTGDPLLLLPAKQTLFGKTYLTIDGGMYYVMNPTAVNLAGQSISTCDLPKAASEARPMDMLVKGLNLPVKPRPFDVSYGNLHLTGNLNENLMPIVYRYPQMETADFAISELDPALRRDLVRQVKEQLGDKSPLEATNELLQFVQFGFDYATDNDFHGFEKPYFLEENLYYPKNDCEDRAIFYTYLLWNALGLESQLLFFPGHESASVALPDEVTVKGTGYSHEGKQYYISDPTYVGSVTGMCMPQFETTAPKIDYTYK